MMNIRSTPALFSLALTLSPTVAFAQQTQAEKLFDKAVQELDEQNYAAACAHFEESLRLEPDGGTKFYLAQCRDKEGKALEALHRYEQFVDYFLTLATAQKTKYMDTLKEATDRIEALKRLLPRLKLKMPENVPEGTVVLLDGTEIPAAKLDQVHWLEPGVHKLTVTVPGREPKEWPVDLKPRQPLEELVRIPDAPQPTPATLKPVPVKPKPVAASQPSPMQWNGLHVAIAASGSVAAIGLVTWAVPGWRGLSKKVEVNAHCIGNSCDTLASLQSAREMQAHLKDATVGFIVGIAGSLSFVTLLAYNSKSKTPKPRVEATVLQFDTTGATFGLKGAF